MQNISRKEVEKKFPNAIRGIENLVIGKTYQKVYSHIDNCSYTGKLINVWLARTDIGNNWKYKLKGNNGKIYEDSCADSGIIPYAKNSWNATNYLSEVIMPTEYEEYDVTATYYYTANKDEPYDEHAGSLQLHKIRTPQDYPIELEIDGVIYYPQL